MVLETPSTCDTGNSAAAVLPPLTQYHVAAEQQEAGVGEDDEDNHSDRVSLNCEDGSLSSHSTGEHYAMEDILNHSRRPVHQQQTRTNEKNDFDENEQQEHREHQPMGVLDFSLKFDETNKQSNRSRSMNTGGKSRSLKRKHQNGSTDIPTRIFHADAFCGICRKVRPMKTIFFEISDHDFSFRNFVINIFSKLSTSSLV